MMDRENLLALLMDFAVNGSKGPREALEVLLLAVAGVAVEYYGEAIDKGLVKYLEQILADGRRLKALDAKAES